MFEKEINPENIREAEIAVVIPSYNEADSISHPTKMASQGLKKYFPNKKSVIINADNHSPDNTEKVFLNTETEIPKIYITTPENTPGKGWNFLNAFKKCNQLGVKAIVCIDADLISITPEWIKYMLSPILYENYDYLTPLYSRHKYDGTITNNICYPLIYGIFGKNIRQPIGGDFALSSKLLNYILTKPWNKTTYQYGIDIFMTMQAILGNFKIGQVGLGAKIHKPSAPKLGPMFTQVVNTALTTVTENFHKWKNINSIQQSEILGIKNLEHSQELEVDKEKILENSKKSFQESKTILQNTLNQETYQKIEQDFNNNNPKITTEDWVEILYQIIEKFSKTNNQEEIVEAMKCLYFARVYTFMNDTWEIDSLKCEESIIEQGKKVFENRNKIINKLNENE